MEKYQVYSIPFFNFGVKRILLLKILFAVPENQPLLSLRGCAAINWLGWGRKKSSRLAYFYARVTNGRAVQLEDGFLRSFGAGDSFPPLSLVIDDQGIYYDSTHASSLESILNSKLSLVDDIAPEVARAKRLILEYRLSKYNHSPILDVRRLRAGDAGRVLVVDQTTGDMSVALGGASAADFSGMLRAALAENPTATVYVKTHPEASSGRKGGYLTGVRDDLRTVVLRNPVNPLSLIEKMDRVYVVTSTMGFEALLAGKPVTCFGIPWYSGWGVTDDRQPCPRRVCRRTVDELFAAAYFHYARYLNPVTRKQGTIFDVIDWLIRQRLMAFPQPSSGIQ